MNQRPAPPPEGRLIAEAADRLDLSIREAARRAGLSYGRWRQITAGYQNVSPGEYAIVRAPAKTIAKMARVVGVTSGQLAAVGRADAAEVLEETPRREEPALDTLPLLLPEPVSLDARRAARQMKAVVDIALGGSVEQVRAMVKDYPAGTPGHVIFPDDRVAAELWDLPGLPLDDRYAFLAHHFMNQTAQRAAGSA